MNIKINNFAWIGLLLLSVFFSFMGIHKDNKIGVISIEKAYLNQKELIASDYFKEIQYIPLETNDESLVGDNPVVWVSGDRIIVTSDQNQCLSFDKTTGKFIGSIGHIGNDPEGSSSLSGWLNAASGRVYFSAGNGKSVIYDLNGKGVSRTFTCNRQQT